MSDGIQWNLLGRPVDVGGAFNAGFEGAQARRKEMEQQSALRAYAQNPQDVNALAGINATNPMLGMQLQERQRARAAAAAQQQKAEQAAGLEQHRETILMGAKIIRQVQPKDEAGWQQVRAIAAQYRIPMDQVPETFDPAYVRGVVATADALDPVKTAQPTEMQRNYEFLNSQDPKLAQGYLKSRAEGPPIMFDVNGDGAPDLVPRSYLNGPQPTPAAPDAGGDLEAQAAAAIAAGADPAKVRARLQQMKGGSGPAAAPASFQP